MDIEISTRKINNSEGKKMETLNSVSSRKVKDLNPSSGHSSMKKDMEVMVEFDLSNFHKGSQV